MSCAKSSLQTFVAWLHQPQHELFTHVITATLTTSGEGELRTMYAGTLTYVPVRIGGVPPQPGKPGLQFASFFQGNLADTSATSNTRHVFIELFDPIRILVETISGQSITSAARLTDITCASSGDGLTINSPGDDGRVYELTI